MKRPNKLTLIHIVIPALIIFILFNTAYTTSDEILRQGLIFGSLIIYFPILLFVQGLICALLRDNIFLSFGISSAMFMIMIIIDIKKIYFMTMLGITYWLIAYLMIGFIGYGIGLLVQKNLNRWDS